MAAAGHDKIDSYLGTSLIGFPTILNCLLLDPDDLDPLIVLATSPVMVLREGNAYPLTGVKDRSRARRRQGALYSPAEDLQEQLFNG